MCSELVLVCTDSVGTGSVGLTLQSAESYSSSPHPAELQEDTQASGHHPNIHGGLQ